MKRIIWILLLVLTLTLATPAYADSKETVGDRLGIFYSGDQTFPAGQPFYIQHGFSVSAPAPILGAYNFKLDVDGMPVKADFRMVTVDPSGDPNTISVTWVYNFPDGMTGTHTFTGHWISPCGDIPRAVCPYPSFPVESRTSTVVVTFIE